MRSCTVRDSMTAKAKIRLSRMTGRGRSRFVLNPTDNTGYGQWPTFLDLKAARKFFKAGLQMCDEIEAEGK